MLSYCSLVSYPHWRSIYKVSPPDFPYLLEVKTIIYKSDDLKVRKIVSNRSSSDGRLNQVMQNIFFSSK